MTPLGPAACAQLLFTCSFFEVAPVACIQHLVLCSPDADGCCCTLPTDASCLTLAGAFFSIVAGYVNKRWGRKVTMMTGGAAFCIGAILCAFAQVRPVALAGGR